MSDTHCLIPVYDVNVFHACEYERIGYDDVDPIIYDEERKAAKPFSCVHWQIWYRIRNGDKWEVECEKDCGNDWVSNVNFPGFSLSIPPADRHHFDVDAKSNNKCQWLDNYVYRDFGRKVWLNHVKAFYFIKADNEFNKRTINCNVTTFQQA